MMNEELPAYSRRLVTTLAVAPFGPLPIVDAQNAARDPKWRTALEACQLYAVVRRPRYLFSGTMRQQGSVVALIAESQDPSRSQHIDIELDLGSMTTRDHACEAPAVNIVERRDAVVFTCHCGALDDGAEMLWLSLDAIAQAYLRRESWAVSFTDAESFVEYDLLYFGSAPSRDVVARVFDNGHHALQPILIDHWRDSCTEIVFVAFSVKCSILQSVHVPSAYVSPEQWVNDYTSRLAVVEAEKAVISGLHPRSNTVLYGNYPNGEGGFDRTALDELVVHIASPIALAGAKRTWRGGLADASVLRVTGTAASFEQGPPITPESVTPGVFELS